MCGRTVLVEADDELREFFGLTEIPDLEPKFNIAPTEPQAIIRTPGRLELARFGLIPPFAKKPGEGARFINARAETVATLPVYRDAFRERRCLVVVSGFYEWKATQTKAKQPMFIHRADGKPFAFAGLWATWRSPEGELMDSCSIITRTPSEQMATVHDRMPVILAREEYAAWIDPHTADVRPLLAGHPEGLALRPVSTLVNKAGVNDPRCLEEAPEVATQSTLF